MRVAIIGAGLAGLASCWYFLQKRPTATVHLFDPLGPGGQSRQVAAGLLHGYVGLEAKKSPWADEALACSMALIKQIAPQAIISTGILRVARSLRQESSFQKTALSYADVLAVENCHDYLPQLPTRPGIFIQTGVTVDVAYYTEQLARACSSLGALYFTHRIETFDELSSYDLRLVAAGAKSNYFWPHLALTAVKGQMVKLKGAPTLPFSVTGSVYLSSQQEGCFVGATYEHHFTTEDPVAEEAKKLLLPQAIELFPPLAQAEVVDVRAGLRASTPDHLPLLQQMDKNSWILTGFGSRGLLYHALFAKRWASAEN